MTWMKSTDLLSCDVCLLNDGEELLSDGASQPALVYKPHMETIKDSRFSDL